MRPPSRRRALLCLALALAPARLAARQEGATSEAPGPEELPQIEDVLFVEERLPHVPTSNTIATKLPLPLRRTPASVGVLGEAALAERDADLLGEALAGISGVNAQTQSGVADFFVVRGFDSTSSGLVLVDGANEPEISFYELYNVNRVEVLKGPGSFLYGGAPTASTVNLVRKQPAPERFLELELSAGSFGSYDGRLDWNAADRDGTASLRLNGLWRESDGHRDGKRSRVAALNPAFTWRPRPGTTWNVNLERVDNRYQPDAGLPILYGPGAPSLAPVPRRRAYDSPFDRSQQELSRAQVDFESVRSERLTLRNKAYYRRLTWDSRGTLFSGVFPNAAGGLDLHRNLLLLDDEQEFVGDQLEALLALSTGAVTHRLLTGVEVARLADRFALDVGFLPPIDLFAPVETAAGPIFRIPGQLRRGDARSRVVAPYAVDQIALSERVELTAGARFDRIDYEDPATGTERGDGQLSPLLGLVWSPRPEVSFYGHASRAFAPPSTLVVGEREPEKSEQVEAGVKAGLAGGRLQAALAVYRLDREDVAIPDDNGITQQIGSQRARGVELDLAAEPRPQLRAFLSYAYNDSELTRFQERVLVAFQPPTFAVLDRSGNVPAFAPRHLASLWVSRRFAGGVVAAAGARYLSEQFVAEDNLFALDSALTLDAALAWERGGQRWSLHLKNLTDEDYETRGIGGSSAIPAPGFSLSGSWTLRLGWGGAAAAGGA